MKRLILFLVGLLAAAPIVSAQVGGEVAVMQIRFGKEKQLRRVVLEFQENQAPRTVENFKRLARKRFYNGQAFHRVFPGTLVQIGDPKSKRKDRFRVGTGGPGYTVPAELSNLRHVRGTVSMARLPDNINPARNSNGSQFFIALRLLPDYDRRYTAFAKVVEGIEVLDEISNKSSDPNDYPIERIEIRSLKILPVSKVPALPAPPPDE